MLAQIHYVLVHPDYQGQGETWFFCYGKWCGNPDM